MKKKICLIISMLLILVVAGVIQFTQFGYLMTVPYRSAFTEIADHVYINQNYSGNRQELLGMIMLLLVLLSEHLEMICRKNL